MDINAIKNYLENLEKIHQAKFKNDSKYFEECKKNKANKKDYKIEQGHIIEEYFNKYQKKLQNGKLVAFKENELWLMNKDTKYWEINNDSEFKYFEVPSKNIAAPLFVPKVLLFGLIGASLAFAGLFTWKMVSGGPAYKLNINCENCDYTVLGNKTSFKAHEVAYITFNETDPDMYKLPDGYSSQCFNVEGDVEDSRRYYGDNHVLAVEFDDKDISIDASSFPTFTTFTLEEKSTYDPLKFKYVADSDNNIYVDWGDGNRVNATGDANKVVTGTPLGNEVRVYSNDIYGFSFSINSYTDSQIVGMSMGYYITTIPGYDSFSGNTLTAMKNITFSANIKTIGAYAFRYLKPTGNLYIETPSPLNIGNGAFQYSNFSSIHVECPNAFINYQAFSYMDNLENAYLKANKINYNLFVDNPKLKHVYIEIEDVESGSHDMFTSNISILEDLTLVGSNEDRPLELDPNSRFFGLSDNNKLKNVKLVNVKSIPYTSGEFLRCSGLSQIDLGEKMEDIGEATFSGCSSLTSITLPSTLHEIKRDAFNDCSQLESIVFKGSINLLGNNVFNGCDNLKIIDLSNNINNCPDTPGSNPFGSPAIDSIEEIRVFNSNVKGYFEINTYFAPYADKIVVMH